MRMDKLTIKSREALADTQAIAQRLQTPDLRHRARDVAARRRQPRQRQAQACVLARGVRSSPPTSPRSRASTNNITSRLLTPDEADADAALQRSIRALTQDAFSA
jgi:sarcosine oxidase gamma subunit